MRMGIFRNWILLQDLQCDIPETSSCEEQSKTVELGQRLSLKRPYPKQHGDNASLLYSKGPSPTGVQLKRDLPGITGLLYYPREFQLHQFCLCCPNAASAADPNSLSQAQRLLERMCSARLIYPMSGNIVLAWDFNQNAGRILLKLPNGVNVQLDGCI